MLLIILEMLEEAHYLLQDRVFHHMGKIL
ncbi:uncharacterized protein METZ01_LOCUS404704 [marine metagenome]|uniref:Uncharacterized protein n=1 Tax=marine metagenome TaxID=408172 RepID=A0A382VZN1_9ZZZZ